MTRNSIKLAMTFSMAIGPSMPPTPIHAIYLDKTNIASRASKLGNTPTGEFSE